MPELGRGWWNLQQRHHKLRFATLPHADRQAERMYASITWTNFNRTPSAVASNWKSIAQTKCGCSVW
jgi:hypothetical protein